MRWQQFETLMAGGAQCRSRASRRRLYYQVTGDPNSAGKRIAWALTPAADLRQLALVFDWCQDLLERAAIASARR